MAEGNVTIAPTNPLPTQEKNIQMRKSPTYTDILKAIAKVKTIKQLDKVQEQVVDYTGPYSRSKNLYDKYNDKNYKIRNITKPK